MTVAQCAVWMTERRRAVLVQSLILGLFRIDPDTLDLRGRETRDDQDIGEACEGAMIEQCRPVFQDKLFVACRDCPGPSRFN